MLVEVLSPNSIKSAFYLTAANVTLWLGAVILQVLLLSEISALKNIYMLIYIGTAWSVLMHAATVASLFGLYKNNLSHIKGFMVATRITVVISFVVFAINVAVVVLLAGYTVTSQVLSGFTGVLTFYIFIESAYMVSFLKKEIRLFRERERMLRIHRRLDQQEFYQNSSESPSSLVNSINSSGYKKNNIKFKYQRF